MKKHYSLEVFTWWKKNKLMGIYPLRLLFPCRLWKGKQKSQCWRNEAESRDHTYSVSLVKWGGMTVSQQKQLHMRAIFIGICSLSKAFNSIVLNWKQGKKIKLEQSKLVMNESYRYKISWRNKIFVGSIKHMR